MDIEDLMKKFEESVRAEFDNLRTTFYNPNVKGGQYEKILLKFLQTYLGDVFKFDSRVALIDTNHDIFQLLEPSQNEFDVVAQFKTTFPSKVYVHNDIQYVSYDSCAFIVEVAQTLTKRQLQDDLNKLGKLTTLNKKLGWLEKGKRFGTTIGGPANVEYPLRVLFYYEATISVKELMSALEKEIKSWDILIVFKDERMLINANLPIIIKKPPIPWFSGKGNVLLWLFHVLGLSIPYPIFVDAFGPFRKALFRKQEKREV
jgi:hypothetical protein